MHLRKTLSHSSKKNFLPLQILQLSVKHGCKRSELGELLRNCSKGERSQVVKGDLSNWTNETTTKRNDSKYKLNCKIGIKRKVELTEKIQREKKMLYGHNEGYYKNNEKRNYLSGNAHFLNNSVEKSTFPNVNGFNKSYQNETIHSDNEKQRNAHKVQKNSPNQANYLVNENVANMYINKLHDYINIAQRSESDKRKINKILSKLKNENITNVSILQTLKDLCNLFLKKSSIQLDEPIALNYLENKSSLKKLKNYLEEYFIYIENYLKNYSAFINEENIIDLFKYFYYLNYSVQQKTMELLLERFYLCINKMDDLKIVQVYYIVQSFYKHFYFKKPDYYLSLAVNEKLSKKFLDKVYLFPTNLNTHNLFINTYKNNYWNYKNEFFETPSFVETKSSSMEKKKEEELYEISEESKELMHIFKYIHNYYKDMNFVYHPNVIYFIEKDIPHFSINELLIILGIYKNGRNDLFNTKIIRSLFHKVDQMEENHLLLFSKHLNQLKNWLNDVSQEIRENEAKNSVNDLFKLTVANKILEIVRKDKEFFLPDNTATILLNINGMIKSIINHNEFYKKEKNVLGEELTGDNLKLTNEMQQTNEEEMQLKLQKEIIAFCDEYINNVHSFDTILNLYLLYIKNESIKSKTINIFEQKLKTNKNKLNQQDISNIILSLSMCPFHASKMLHYLENLINERLEEANEMYENELNVEGIIKKTRETELGLKEKNTNESVLNFQTNHLIDISMSLGIIGRKNLKLWNYIDVDKLILTTNKHLLLYLVYSFLLTNYWNPLSWYFIIKRIVEDVKIFKKKHYELLYEILKCSLLFNAIDLTNFTNNSFEHLSTTTTNIFMNSAKRKGINESNHHFVKNFNYLLTTSYNHYKLKLIKNQYVSKVPYEEIFQYLKFNYEKNIEFKQLYIIPYLLKDYKIIIDPLPSTPIHKSSGFIMGEIQLKHQVFQFEKYNVLSFYDALWEKYIIVDKQGNSKYDIKALSEHFQTYIESQMKIESNKRSSNVSTKLTNSARLGEIKKEKETNQLNYLKVKKPNLTVPPNKKYLTNKGGLKQHQDKYLTVKTKVGKR